MGQKSVHPSSGGTDSDGKGAGTIECAVVPDGQEAGVKPDEKAKDSKSRKITRREVVAALAALLVVVLNVFSCQLVWGFVFNQNDVAYDSSQSVIVAWLIVMLVEVIAIVALAGFYILLSSDTDARK